MFRMLAAVSILCLTFASAGCERKEKVIDIETPGGEIEVLKSDDTGEVEIEINDK